MSEKTQVGGQRSEGLNDASATQIVFWRLSAQVSDNREPVGKVDARFLDRVFNPLR
jgi:hypothetical protein